MAKVLFTLFFIALFVYVIADKESKNGDQENKKTEKKQEEEEFDDNSKETETVSSDSDDMKQNMEAPASYIPFYYGYVPFYELIGYEV